MMQLLSKFTTAATGQQERKLLTDAVTSVPNVEFYMNVKIDGVKCRLVIVSVLNAISV